MPGNAVEATRPVSYASRCWCLVELLGRKASFGKRADRGPRAGQEWKKSYLIG